MESHFNSFHLDTSSSHPFICGNTSKSKRSNGYTSSLKSSRHMDILDNGTFEDILEYNKHLAALRDLEKLKQEYYEDYIENLERKVLYQRRKLAKADATVSPKAHRVRQQKAKLPKLQRHNLRHDAEYMRKVSKSKYYHLLAAKKMMIEKRLIKSQSEEEQFWHQALHDDDLWLRPLPTDVPSDIMSRLMIDRFSSHRPPFRSLLKKNRRVTFNETPMKSSYGHDGTAVVDTAKDPKLLRFKVKLDPPKLHSMKALSPLPPIESTVISLPDSTEKFKRMKNFQRVRHAYDVAMVNHAAAHQMLKSHGLSPDSPNNFLTSGASDNLPNDQAQSLQSDKRKTKSTPTVPLGKNEQAFLTEPVYGRDKILIPDLEYKYPHHKRQTKQRLKNIGKSINRNKQDSERQNVGDHKVDMSKVTPLDYDMMLAQGDIEVKDATCLSSFWVNYITTSKS